MVIQVGINGFGRIGRNILRAILESGRTDIRVAAINDLAPVSHLAHLLEFDSVHGRLRFPIEVLDDAIDVGNGRIKVTAIRDPGELPWKGIDVALECTGLFASHEKASRHLENGSSKVLVSAPAANADKTVVFGVNHSTLEPADRIVSNASCTTNCLAPVVRVLNDEIGITRGFMTTVSQLYRRSTYTGRHPQGSVPCACRRTVHDSHLHRSRPRGRIGNSRTIRKT